MSSDPLARSDIWAEAPNETDYDAVYAAVMATERGRWFLNEYASRNRQGDMQAVIAVLARLEAAIGGDRAALASGVPGHTIDIARSIERIQDIAFTLRERNADEALCDALDDVAREFSAACARNKNKALGAELPAASLAASEADTASEPASNGASAAVSAVSPLDYDGGSERLPDKPAEDRRRWYIEPPDFAFPAAEREVESDWARRSKENGEARSLLPEPLLLPGPLDDPGGLFELPLSEAPPPASTKLEPVMRPIPRPSSPDSLAAMRSLSEEEVIALFG
jgi:hypothetical protein